MTPNDGTVYNVMYVHYDDDEKVHLISNIVESSMRVFEIDIELIGDFLDGKKTATNYKIGYFLNLSKGIIEDEIPIITNNFLYVVPVVLDTHSDITLFYNKSYWTVHANDRALDRLSVAPMLMFYICKKHDPHYMYASFTVDPAALMKQDIVIDFTTELEIDLELFSLVTSRKLNSYGIIDVKN
jgi:hypothetical protein